MKHMKNVHNKDVINCSQCHYEVDNSNNFENLNMYIVPRLVTSKAIIVIKVSWFLLTHGDDDNHEILYNDDYGEMKKKSEYDDKGDVENS